MTVSVGMETERLKLITLVGMVTVSVGMETKEFEFEKAGRDGVEHDECDWEHSLRGIEIFRMDLSMNT